jgi:hypothetical protein
MDRTLLRQYGLIATLLAAFVAALWFVLAQTPVAAAEPAARQLIQPMIALFGLTAIVWVLMFAFRNVAVAKGAASIRYYQTYGADAPPEWVERPARTFMNLLEVPVLFYVVCLLMLQTGQWDGVQVSLAWMFVGLRCLHAGVYIGLNYVPLRLATYVMGCVSLAVIWYRFAVAFV